MSAATLGLHVHVTMRGGVVVRCQFAREGLRESVLSEAALAVRGHVSRHMSRGDVDLSVIPVDLQGVSLFHRKVLQALRETKPGEVVTYGELAARVGVPGAARAVGEAMARNPIPLIVPCHRVLASGGGDGGYSALGGLATKFALLRLEGWTRPSDDQRRLDAF